MTDKPTDEIEAWKIERDKLYELIGHGDFEHRTWLYRELTNFFSSRHSAAKEEVEPLHAQIKVSLDQLQVEFAKVRALEAENASLIEHVKILMETKSDVYLKLLQENDALKKENESLIKQKSDIYMTLTKENFSLKTAQKDLIEAADDWVRECEEECGHQPTWQCLSRLLARHRKVGE